MAGRGLGWGTRLLSSNYSSRRHSQMKRTLNNFQIHPSACAATFTALAAPSDADKITFKWHENEINV